MNSPCTKKNICILAPKRNHVLISMTNYKNVHSRITLYCNGCQNTFDTTLHSYKNAKQTGCPYCKKIHTSKTHKNKITSLVTKQKISQANKNKPGSLKGKTGSQHPRWTGNSACNRLKGSSTEAYLWRKSVLKIYSNICIITKSTCNLQCHHLDSYDMCKSKRNVVSNGVVVTAVMNKMFHKIYGYGKNTEKQFSHFCLTQFNVQWNLIKINLYDNQQPSSLNGKCFQKSTHIETLVKEKVQRLESEEPYINKIQ